MNKVIRVRLPYQLQVLAGTGPEVELAVQGQLTIEAVLTALETRYPMLQGAVLEHETRQRRPLIRFFADARDLSHQPLTTLLPDDVASGNAPFFIVGAIAGG